MVTGRLTIASKRMPQKLSTVYGVAQTTKVIREQRDLLVKTKSTPIHAASFILRTNWMITRESYSLGFLVAQTYCKECACNAVDLG